MVDILSKSVQTGRLSESMTQGGNGRLGNGVIAGRRSGMLGRLDLGLDVRDALDQSYSRLSQLLQ
jgi:hypothetical protein